MSAIDHLVLIQPTALCYPDRQPVWTRQPSFSFTASIAASVLAAKSP
jgi:hypothetical protein